MTVPMLQAAVAAAALIALAGCSSAPKETPAAEEPTEITVQGPREASVSIVDKSQAGAAVRSGEDLDVLYSGHYQGPTIEQKTAKAKTESADASAARKTNAQSAKFQTKKDKSAYASKKDRSAYSSKDKSVYSKKSR